MKLEKGKKYEHRPPAGTVCPVLDFVIVDGNSKNGVIVVCQNEGPYLPGYIFRTDICGRVGGSQVLFEVSPYVDWKIDDKVIVTGSDGEGRRRYFAGMKNDKPCYYRGGKTSWSATPGEALALSSYETITRVENQ